MQQEGFTLMCPTPNKRPIHVTDAMAHEAALELAAELIKGAGSDNTLDELAGDIIKASRWNRYMDGYELARTLETQCGWSPDASMVEDLDLFARLCDQRLAAAERLWASENPMDPPLPVGTQVKHQWGTGVIADISKYKPYTYNVTIADKPSAFALVTFEEARAA